MNFCAASTPVSDAAAPLAPFDAGSGPCVVFVADTAAREWDATARAIARTANAVVLDPLAGDISVAAQHLAVLLHALGRGPYHLVAAARAAVSVCRFALDEPQLAASCTLVNAWPLAPGSGRGPINNDASLLGRTRSDVYRRLIEHGMPCPTLLVWSIDDPIGDRDAATALNEIFVRRRRETEIRYFARTGTDVFRERPAAFDRMLAMFVDDVAAG
jgi:hypothetical protein